MARTQAEFARFSAKDAAAYPAYDAALEKIAAVAARSCPARPRPTPAAACARWSPLARQGWPLARLDRQTQRDLLDMFTKSAREFLDGWFEDDASSRAFAFDAVVGNYAGVSTPGLGLCAAAPRVRRGERQEGRLGPCGRRHGRDHRRRWRAACATRAWRSALRRRWRRCWSMAGKAAGVRLESGEEMAAPIVAANVGPALLYRQLVDPAISTPISAAGSRSSRPARAPSG